MKDHYYRQYSKQADPVQYKFPKATCPVCKRRRCFVTADGCAECRGRAYAVAHGYDAGIIDRVRAAYHGTGVA